MKLKIVGPILSLLLTASVAGAVPLWERGGKSYVAAAQSKAKPLSKRESTASMGNEGAHGGDPYALEFVALGKIIAQAIRGNTLSLQDIPLDINEFEKSLDTVLVYSAESERVILNGMEVSALNGKSIEGNDNILVNSTRWRTALLAEKLRLVMHEYFGVMNIERDVYKVSADFYLQLNLLAKQLIASGQSASQYYGVSESGYPLLESGTNCEESDAPVRKALSYAQKQALVRCAAELGSNCNLVGNLIEKQFDHLTGVVSCKITSIAK